MTVLVEFSVENTTIKQVGKI